MASRTPSGDYAGASPISGVGGAGAAGWHGAATALNGTAGAVSPGDGLLALGPRRTSPEGTSSVSMSSADDPAAAAAAVENGAGGFAGPGHHGTKRRRTRGDSGQQTAPRAQEIPSPPPPSKSPMEALEMLASTAAAAKQPPNRRASLPTLGVHAPMPTKRFPSPFAHPTSPSVYPGTNALPPRLVAPQSDTPLSVATITSSAAREQLIGSLQTLLTDYDASLLAELASWQGAVRSREATILELRAELDLRNAEILGLRREVSELRARVLADVGK